MTFSSPTAFILVGNRLSGRRVRLCEAAKSLSDGVSNVRASHCRSAYLAVRSAVLSRSGLSPQTRIPSLHAGGL